MALIACNAMVAMSGASGMNQHSSSTPAAPKQHQRKQHPSSARAAPKQRPSNTNQPTVGDANNWLRVCACQGVNT
eukprot:4557433-Lingulodinium_polyedra.AAC.1